MPPDSTKEEQRGRELTCPQCHQPLTADARSCPHCGVDLAIVALLAERAYSWGTPASAPISAPPEVLVPRIGEFLLEQGLITSAQLKAALRRQKELNSSGQQRLLGQTLIEMGYVDREMLDSVINRQIIALHAAVQEANRNLEKRVEERTSELSNALQRLAEVSQVKANLISNVSHELRTPLAHIKGYVELVCAQELGPLTSEQEHALEVVRRATGRLEQLIGDLIEFSTASREGLQVRLQEVPVSTMILAAVQRLSDKAAKAGVTLVTEVPSDLPPLRGDAQRLDWVMFQLVDNAIKFTPSGGRVTVSGKAEDRLVTLSVSDTGIGIPESRLAEVFEPLHQLDASTTRRYGGTGLGLALVKLVLDAHGAEIKAQSEVGKGSVFWFSLPAASKGQ